MKILLRLRLDEKKRVLEIDPDTIRSMRINDMDDGSHCLSMSNDSQEYIVQTGTFDKCTEMLQKIHNILDVHIIDLV